MPPINVNASTLLPPSLAGYAVPDAPDAAAVENQRGHGRPSSSVQDALPAPRQTTDKSLPPRRQVNPYLLSAAKEYMAAYEELTDPGVLKKAAAILAKAGVPVATTVFTGIALWAVTSFGSDS